MNRTRQPIVESPSYRKARNKILVALIGSFIIFGMGFSIILAGLGFTAAGVILIVICFVAYVATKVYLEV